MGRHTRLLCPKCRVDLRITQKAYDDGNFATKSLNERLTRLAVDEVRVFKSECEMLTGLWRQKSDSECKELDASFISEAVEVQTLYKRNLLRLKTARNIWENLQHPRSADATQMFISEMLGCRLYHQYRFRDLPGLEVCLAQKPSVMVAGSIDEVKSALGDASFARILSRTALHSFGSLLEWPGPYVDFNLIHRSLPMDSAFFQYLRNRADTTWMALPCDAIETPFVPLEPERMRNGCLTFIFPSVQPPAIDVEPTQEKQIMHSVRHDVDLTCERLSSNEEWPEKRMYHRRDLTTLETLLVTKEVGLRVWDGLVAPLFNQVPTTQEEAKSEPDDDLTKQLAEVDELLRKFRITWHLYFSNYWHQVMGTFIDGQHRQIRQISAGAAKTLRNLLVKDTILDKQPVHKCVKQAAMNGVAEIIRQEAIGLAEHHVALGYKPTIANREELEGDHVHQGWKLPCYCHDSNVHARLLLQVYQ